MEYCYSETDSLWYGSWNCHFCRWGKCAADLHSRLTGVNPLRKQRCCFSSYRRDTSDPNNYQNLGYWFTIRHRCICMWSWTELLFFSFQLRAKTKWSPLRMSTEICRLGGSQFLPIWMTTICRKTFSPKTTKMLSTRNSSMLMMSSSVHLFLNLSVPWQNMVLRDLKPEICICDFHFCE